MKRIWAHRVNSLGKLSEVVDTFAGAELDLVFDEAAKGLTVRDGPTLEEILDAPYVRHRQIGLWLDLENLNTENSSKILAQLSSLDVRHGLKDRVIVATPFTGEGLDRFAASGFYTSYHLPGERIGEAMERGDTERLSHLAAEACAVAHRQRVAAVSFDSGLYPFVRNYLTRCVNAADLEYLTWDLAVSSSTRGFADTVSQWSLDDRVKVILVPFASRFD